jgi:membrane associated rhomboid family serine protease
MPLYITYFIIGITVMVSIPAMSNPELKSRLMFNAYAVKHQRQWYRLFTHALVHGDWMHLFMNMYVLYSFGCAREGRFFEDEDIRQVLANQTLEQQFGTLFHEKAHLFYILLYVGAIFMSSVYSYEKNKDNMYYNALGASGAVAAVVFASILINPMGGIGIIFIPIFIPSWIFGILYLVYSWYMAKKGDDNIGHDAHFWGAVYGMAFTLCLKPALASSFLDQVRGHVG